MFRSISQWILNGTTTNHHKPCHGPLQMMTWIITNHYKSPQVEHNMNHHKSQITTNHHKPWHKPPWTMTETSTKHDMNHYKSPQTITWTIMMTQKELCIKPYGFLIDFSDFNSSSEMVCSRCTSRFLSIQHSEIFLEYSRFVWEVSLQFKRYLTI